jgi:hypothetical protein
MTACHGGCRAQGGRGGSCRGGCRVQDKLLCANSSDNYAAVIPARSERRGPILRVLTRCLVVLSATGLVTRGMQKVVEKRRSASSPSLSIIAPSSTTAVVASSSCAVVCATVVRPRIASAELAPGVCAITAFCETSTSTQALGCFETPRRPLVVAPETCPIPTRCTTSMGAIRLCRRSSASSSGCHHLDPTARRLSRRSRKRSELNGRTTSPSIADRCG